MNAPIARLFGLTVLLFIALIAWTSSNAVLKADERRENALNRRPLLEEQRIRRGVIRAADGTLIARSVRNPDGTYSRRYPDGELFGHVVGYSYTKFGRTGLERSRNAELVGERNELTSVLDQLRGKEQEGDDVVTTLDRRAQQLAFTALNGRKGSVVALDPSTGAVKVMVSNPRFDPGSLRVPGTLGRLNKDPDSPILNRATQSGYPPGSTMKVVTAIAAIDSGRYKKESQVDGKNGKKISGVPLNNFGGATYGNVTLTEALTKSINTVWGEVAEKLGKSTMERYMDRLGFGVEPPLDLPSDQLRPSGEYRNGRILDVESDAVDVGRMGIGQDKLNVTPLQMAMVAASVANGGKLMRPHLTQKVVDRDGRTVDETEPEEMSEVMSPESASEVGVMMASVVREGSGTAAALSGIEVAGKTGTAEVDRDCGPNQVWFIGFAPVRNPKVAVAVTIECGDGTGGTVAAPVAKQVMESLL